MSQSLITGGVFVFNVTDIKAKYTGFAGDKGWKNCHYFELTDETGQKFNTQVCDDAEEQNYCNYGDTVEVKIKKYAPSHDLYTLWSIRPVKQKKASSEDEYFSERNELVVGAAEVNGIKEARKGSPRHPNPTVAGTAASISLSQAIEFHKLPPAGPGEDEVTEKSILQTADIFFDWLTQKNA